MEQKTRFFSFCFVHIFLDFSFINHQETFIQNRWKPSLIKKKGAYLRFGDGDVILANGQDDSLQKNNAPFAKRNERSFSPKWPHVLQMSTTWLQRTRWI